jgi:hypothetical protein
MSYGKRSWRWTFNSGYVCVEMYKPHDDEKITVEEVQVVPVDAVVVEPGTREWAVVMALRGKRISKLYPNGNVSTCWSAEQIITRGADWYKWADLDVLYPVPPVAPPADKLTKEEREARKWLTGNVFWPDTMTRAPLSFIADALDRLAPPPLAEPWKPKYGVSVLATFHGLSAKAVYKRPFESQGHIVAAPDTGEDLLVDRVEPLREEEKG